MNRNEVLNDYITRLQDTPTMTIAKLAIKEHPSMFTSLEAARNAIRYRRGNIGKKNRSDMADKRHVRPNGESGFVFKMPNSIASPTKAFMMPQGKTLICNDAHVPYHDDKAMTAFLEYGDYYSPDTIYLNGDMIDFFAVSRWEKNPEERDLPKEIYLARQFLAHLRERFPKARIIFKVGNHEERWEKYLWAKAPELCGCEFTSFENILDFRKFGIELVKSKQKVKFGKHLTGIHGHEIFGFSVPVNFARTLQTKMNVCSFGGHRHATSEHSHKNADGKYVTCWGVGCLCDMSPDYAILNNWNHGLATVELCKNDFNFTNKRIINGEVK